VPIDLNF